MMSWNTLNEPGHLWHLRYPLVEPVDGMDYLVVATTRPETMLGDTGVAVSPQDDRYKNLVGKKVKLPHRGSGDSGVQRLLR